PSGPGGVITGVVHRAEANYARIKAEKQAALAQSTTNAKTYVQTPTFKQKMNSDWGGLIGTGRGPRGPQEAKTTIKNIFSGFGYDDYEGSKKSIAETLNDGHANCFDLTLAEMYMSGQYGLDSEMVWSTWNGGSHVYPKIGGEVMDAAHYALNKSWTAPPKGPSDQDDSTKTNTISAAINQFPSSAVPKTGSKIGSSINNAIVKPITQAIQYSTKYVKGGVTQINTDFNALVPQATSAWTAVQNAVAGPINNIIGFVSKLRSAVGGSSTGSYAGGDIPAGTTPVLPNKIGTSKTPTFDLPLPTGTSAEKILESLYQGDEAGCPDCGAAGGDNYGIFNGATNWIGKVKNWAYGYAGAKLGLPINASTLSKPAGLFYNWVTKLFSGFNYQFYFDDQKSNAQTLAQKSGNCYDMTQLLMALANAFGIGSSMVHGTWDGTGIGHVWSYINGLGAMDPTALVQRGTWTPPAGSAGGDFRAPSSEGNTFSIDIKIEGDVYGVADLDSRMEAAGEKLMNKIEAKLSLG
ncbi:MAG: transglutaminase-like domain-containing protein, partial [Methanobacterium paludis]|nr:transglutaminase-like domain-containing protein [Methanobacterium paludis]